MITNSWALTITSCQQCSNHILFPHFCLSTVNHARWRSSGGGSCSRQRSTGHTDEEEDCWGPGHGWCLYTDCIRSAQNCKLCFSTAGYYPRPILFLCRLLFSSLTLCFPSNFCLSLFKPLCTIFVLWRWSAFHSSL